MSTLLTTTADFRQQIKAMSEADIPNPSHSPDLNLEPSLNTQETDTKPDEVLLGSQATDTPEEIEGLLSSSASLTEEADESLVQTVDWKAIARQLYQRNCYLVQRMSQLQQELAASQAQLQQQSAQSRPANELNAASEEPKTTQQFAQDQQTLIDDLHERLEASQGRVAQLERECALLGQRYHEQAHRAAQAEKESQDLYERLQQQRRHTWQFKAALNKYLEASQENLQRLGIQATSEQSPSAGRTAPSASAGQGVRSQPIQPWSALDSQSSENNTAAIDPPASAKQPAPESEPSLPKEHIFSAEQYDGSLQAEVSATSELPAQLASAPPVQSPEPAANGNEEKAPSPNPASPSSGKRKSTSTIDLPKFLY